jgi:hypothetical protein
MKCLSKRPSPWQDRSPLSAAPRGLKTRWCLPLDASPVKRAEIRRQLHCAKWKRALSTIPTGWRKAEYPRWKSGWERGESRRTLRRSAAPMTECRPVARSVVAAATAGTLPQPGQLLIPPKRWSSLPAWESDPIVKVKSEDRCAWVEYQPFAGRFAILLRPERHLVPEEFGDQAVVQFEFTTEVPWVLQEPPEG